MKNHQSHAGSWRFGVATLVIALGCFVWSCRQEPADLAARIDELRDSDQIQLSLQLVPSTLRMLNFQQDTALNELLRNLDKVKVHVLRNDNFSSDDFYDLQEALLTENKLEEYLTWEGAEYELQLLGRPETESMVGLLHTTDAHYLLQFQGTMNLTKLPEVYESLSTADSTQESGYTMILDMIRDDQTRRQAREAAIARREAERQREAFVRDSIEQAERTDSLDLTN